MPVLYPLALGVLLSSGGPGCEAPFRSWARDRAAAPSITGVPGLFDVPAAVSMPDRSITMGFNRSPNGATLAGLSDERNALVSFGFLPRVTLAARGSLMDTVNGTWALRDISANAHVLIVTERDWMPSLAVGDQDIAGGHKLFASRYVVMSKTLAGRIRATAGAGTGSGVLGGAFGGIELAPCDWLSFIAEDNARDRNAGVRIAPLGERGAQRGVEPTLDLMWRGKQGRTIAVGLRVQAGGPRFVAEESEASAALRRNTYGIAGAAGVMQGGHTEDALRAAIVSHGFENVRVASDSSVVAVEYENRVFNREEWDALGIVMSEIAHHAPAGATTMRIAIARAGIPVLQVTSGIAEFSAFVAGAVDGSSFARQLVVSDDVAPVMGPAENSSRFRVDVTVRPRVETLLLTEISVAETRLTAFPEVMMHLGTGVAITARRGVVLHTTEGFPPSLFEPNGDQLAVHVARAGIPMMPGTGGVVSQVSAGRFGAREVGVAGQTDITFLDGRMSAGGIVSAFGERAGTFSRSVATGSLRVRHTPMDLTASVTAGRFLNGDVGVSSELERRFGLATVGFFAQHTDFASMAGVHLSIPLTGAHDARPGAIRVRLPDYFDYRKQTQVLARVNAVRVDVARSLDTGLDVLQSYRGRDRLNEAWLDHEVESLRAAAIRWAP